MSFTTVTVTGRFRKADDTPASGRVVFTLTVPLLDSATDQIIACHSVVAPLGTSGTIAQDLVATDDVGITPTGKTYLVAELIDGAVARHYNMALSHSSTTFDLADVTP